MNFDQFQVFYDNEIGPFRNAASELENNINSILDDFRERALFRPRLIESRVKSKKSLYDKIVKNGKVFSRTFETGYINDLIGARIVCHNLCDILDIYASLERDTSLSFLTAHEKDYESQVKQGKRDGYRAFHRDVLFTYDGRQYHAEFQIRTILQDAWAAFMHDDIYEHGLKSGILPDELFELMKDGSSLLYSLDCMADRMRRWISRSQNYSIEASIKHGLIGALNWSTRDYKAPNYESVSRKDIYRINNTDGEYGFSIDAKLAVNKRSEFWMHLSGDTEASKAEVLSVFDNVNGVELIGDSHLSIQKGGIDEAMKNERYLLKINHLRNRRTHKYYIKCKWENTFDQELEYIHIPWKRYYNVTGDYQIEIETDREYKNPPKLYTINESYKALEFLGESLSPPEELGMPLTLVGDKYYLNLSNINEDYFIYWIFERLR